MSASFFLVLRRHISKLRRSVRARKNLLFARLGAWWGGTDFVCARGARFYQRTTVCGDGSVRIGRKVSLGYPTGGGYATSRCELQARNPGAVISIGDHTAVNNGFLVIAAERVEIGECCLIGKDVQILDFDAHGVAPEERRTSIGRIAPVVLGKNVWVGNGAMLLKGTNIGDNSIVAAGAVVPGGDYPADVIAGGNPAKIIGSVDRRGVPKERSEAEDAAEDVR